jgi:signal transduction histidine kinase
MTIKLRILALLSVLGLVFGGIFYCFQRAQESEQAESKQAKVAELTQHLQELVSTSSGSLFRYLRNYSTRSGMVEFIAERDPAWAEKFIKGKMDLYRIDSVWVLGPSGEVLYGMNRLTDSALKDPPLPLAELQPLFRARNRLQFFGYIGDRLYQFQGMPIMAPSDQERNGRPLGWLVAAKHWGGLVLEEIAETGHGRVKLTAATHPSDALPGELEAQLPLLNHSGRPIAGLDYHVKDLSADGEAAEHLEIILFVLSSGLMILLAGLMLHFWILRPFSIVRASLLGNNPTVLAPLLSQHDEFGEMARVVQTSMRDRERLLDNVEERLRLGRELHDGSIQGIYGAGMALSRMRSLMRSDLPAAEALLDETSLELNRVIRDLRGHIEQIEPQTHDAMFGETVSRLVQQLRGLDPVVTELNIDEGLIARFSPLLRSQAMQFVREAVSNALRHGRPSRLAVSWQAAEQGSLLTIKDDGLGFEPGALKPGGHGLGNLAERAVAVGGRLDIQSGPGRGTQVALFLPEGKATS